MTKFDELLTNEYVNEYISMAKKCFQSQKYMMPKVIFPNVGMCISITEILKQGR
jgi:hypothetical protein